MSNLTAAVVAQKQKKHQAVASGCLKQRELFFVCLAISLGIQTLLAPLEKNLGGASWIAVVASTALGLLLAFLYRGWGMVFAGRPWGEIFGFVYGRDLGKILLFCYGLVFLGIAINTMWFLTYFWNSLGLVKTPQLVYVASLLVVIITLVYGGRRVLGRLSNIIVFLAVGAVLINLLFMLKDVKLINLLPLGVFDVKTLSWVSVTTFLILFGELFLTLPFMPVTEQPQKTGRTIAWAVLAAGIIMLLSVIRNVGILGETAKLFTFPTMQALRLVEFGSAFSKIEVLGALVLITIGIIRLGAGALAAFTSFKELWQLPKIWPIILALAVVLLVATPGLYPYVTDLMYLLFTWYPLVVLIFGIVLPLITLWIGHYKNHPKPKDDELKA